MRIVAVGAALLVAAASPSIPPASDASATGEDLVVIRWSPRDDDSDRHIVVVGTERSESFDVVTYLPDGEIYPRMRLTVTEDGSAAGIDVRIALCDLVEEGVAECPAWLFVAKLGEGNDVWRSRSTLSEEERSWMFVKGERGDDDLETIGWGHRWGALAGGRGADQLAGGHGLPGRRGARGGGGDDTFRRSRQAEGGPGDDTLFGTSHRNVLKGGPGEDRILGGAGNDRVHGGPGSDRIRGDRGPDEVDSGRGHDHLELREDPAEADLADCGRGRDSVRRGRLDRLTGCESTRR